jgi:hypothetical protein
MPRKMNNTKRRERKGRKSIAKKSQNKTRHMKMKISKKSMRKTLNKRRNVRKQSRRRRQRGGDEQKRSLVLVTEKDGVYETNVIGSGVNNEKETQIRNILKPSNRTHSLPPNSTAEGNEQGKVEQNKPMNNQVLKSQGINSAAEDNKEGKVEQNKEEEEEEKVNELDQQFSNELTTTA